MAYAKVTVDLRKSSIKRWFDGNLSMLQIISKESLFLAHLFSGIVNEIKYPLRLHVMCGM